MPAPTIGPDERDPATVAPTDSYHRCDPIWAFCGNAWCAGVVEYVSPRAATVTYRPGNSRGTGVDTVIADHLMRRDDLDPVLDQVAPTADHHAGRSDDHT